MPQIKEERGGEGKLIEKKERKQMGEKNIFKEKLHRSLQMELPHSKGDLLVLLPTEQFGRHLFGFLRLVRY